MGQAWCWSPGERGAGSGDGEGMLKTDSAGPGDCPGDEAGRLMACRGDNTGLAESTVPPLTKQFPPLSTSREPQLDLEGRSPSC